MENQENPSIQTNVHPKEPDKNREQSHPDTSAKKTPFLVLFLGITTILASALAGIFAYQTQRLTKEISSMQTAQNQSTPLPTPAPTNDPLLDWKAYSNTSYGFSLQYPGSLEYKEFYNQQTQALSVSFFDPSLANTSGPPYEFEVWKNFQGGWGGNPINQDPFKVDSHEWEITLWVSCGDMGTYDPKNCTQENYLDADVKASTTYNGSKWLVWSKRWKRDDDNEKKEINIFNQILSTFQFIK